MAAGSSSLSYQCAWWSPVLPCPVTGCHVDMDNILPRDAQGAPPQGSPPPVPASRAMNPSPSQPPSHRRSNPLGRLSFLFSSYQKTSDCLSITSLLAKGFPICSAISSSATSSIRARLNIPSGWQGSDSLTGAQHLAAISVNKLLGLELGMPSEAEAGSSTRQLPPG